MFQFCVVGIRYNNLTIILYVVQKQLSLDTQIHRIILNLHNFYDQVGFTVLTFIDSMMALDED